MNLCECGHIYTYHNEKGCGGTVEFKGVAVRDFKPCGCTYYRPAPEAKACEHVAISVGYHEDRCHKCGVSLPTQSTPEAKACVCAMLNCRHVTPPTQSTDLREAAIAYLDKFGEFEPRERDYFATDMASFAAEQLSTAKKTIIEEFIAAVEAEYFSGKTSDPFKAMRSVAERGFEK